MHRPPDAAALAGTRFDVLLDPATVTSWLRLAAGALGRERDALNSINVFPVPDADTGTNLYQTVQEAVRAVTTASVDCTGLELMRRAARGALLGAQGNSGVILSEWLRGLAVAATSQQTVGAGLATAAETAALAVANPVSGTILTAAVRAAEAAQVAEATQASQVVGESGAAGASSVLEAAVHGAREAALASIEVMATLRSAGVLDAGACGLVLILDALRAAQVMGTVQRTVGSLPGCEPAINPSTAALLTLSPVTLGLELSGHRSTPALIDECREEQVNCHDHIHGDVCRAQRQLAGLGEVKEVVDERSEEHGNFTGYEVMFVFRRGARRATGIDETPNDEVAAQLRSDLAAVGDSVVVVGGPCDVAGQDAAWQTHVHTPDVAGALAIADKWASQGRVSPSHVRHLAAKAEGPALVVATGAPALAAQFADVGALTVVPARGAPSNRELASAVSAAASAQVVLIAPTPNFANDRPVPELVQGQSAEPPYGQSAPDLAVISVPSDLHAIVALQAVLEFQVTQPGASTNTFTASGVDLEAVRLHALRALAGLKVQVYDEASPERAITALDQMLRDSQHVFGWVLIDTNVPDDVVGRLHHTASTLEAEVTLLTTGRPGGAIVIGAVHEEAM